MAVGEPFNRHVTVHWSRLGITDHCAAEATAALIKLASDWTRTKGARLLWAWVRENEAGGGSKGSHVHLLLACPTRVPIGRMWRRWLRRVTGLPYLAGSIKSRTIGPSLDCAWTNAPVYAVNLRAVAEYLCKGVPPDHAQALGVRQVKPSGTIIGKRAGVAQGLATPRAAAIG